MKTANILSINGGGIRGLIALQQLVEFEKIIKGPISSRFDYIAGTSTGGIIAVLLSIGYSAEELLNIYTKFGDKIFEKKFLRFGLFRPKYDDCAFNEIIKSYTKDNKLSNCKTSVLIPAYNVSNDTLKLFKFNKAKQIEKDYFLSDVIRATASAPSFFKPWEIDGQKYVDGGLVVNNPAQMTMLEAMKDGYEKFNILSFSTGANEKPLPRKVIKGGMLNWAKPTVDILLTEMDQTTDYELEKLFENSITFAGKRIGMYIRCESLISKSSGEIDDVSIENIQNMIDDGIQSAKINKEKMRAFHINTL